MAMMPRTPASLRFRREAFASFRTGELAAPTTAVRRLGRDFQCRLGLGANALQTTIGEQPK
jgi:hypothetical protein